MYSWEVYYYKNLVKENVSLFVVFCIVISHYVCCTHTVDIFYASMIQSHTNHNITHQLSHMRNLYTPFHPMIFSQAVNNQTKDDNKLPNNTTMNNGLPDNTTINYGWIDTLSNVATTDPFTFIYDKFIKSPNSSGESRFSDPDGTSTAKTQCKITPVIRDEYVDVKHLFHMYLIVMISFVSVWLPSIYVASQNYSLVWVNVILTPTAVYMTFMISLLIHSLVSQQLAICVAMHMTIRHLIALHTTDILAYDTPTPMKHILCVIYPLAVSAILFYISNASNTTLANYNTSTFYMCHVWSMLCCELIRILPLNLLLYALLHKVDINDEYRN
jgi:hypothetical protein